MKEHSQLRRCSSTVAISLVLLAALYGSCFRILLSLQWEELMMADHNKNHHAITCSFGCSSIGSISESHLESSSLAVHHQQSKFLQLQSGVLLVESSILGPAVTRRLETSTQHDFENEQKMWEAEPFASILPDWMKDYFDWHRTSLQELNNDQTKWRSYKYLVVRCLRMDHKCGGASDRLQSIPLALLVASQHQRLLFIEWEKPAALTEFLVPTALAWRLPEWFHKNIQSSTDHHVSDNEYPYVHFQRSPTVLSDKHLSRLDTYSNSTFLDMRYQTHDHGRAYYNAYVLQQERQQERMLEGNNNEPSPSPRKSFDEVFAAVWACVFQPSPPVQAMIDSAVNELGLQDGNYVSLHVRSMYYKDKSNKVSRVENAVHCAAQLGMNTSDGYTAKVQDAVSLPQFPTIYVASDSSAVTQISVQYGTSVLGRRVVALATTSTNISSSQASPLHLDRGSKFLSSSPDAANWMDFDASAYYGVFVDLYMLSRGRCVAFNIGGYGHFASLISPNPTCDSIGYQDGKCERPTATLKRNL